jgi:hypothetical protein
MSIAHAMLGEFEHESKITRKFLERIPQDKSAMREGKPVMTLPRVMLLRSIMLNHWIQHRGQLGVYLRLVGAKVPASYGPSGDEG